MKVLPAFIHVLGIAAGVAAGIALGAWSAPDLSGQSSGSSLSDQIRHSIHQSLHGTSGGSSGSSSGSSGGSSASWLDPKHLEAEVKAQTKKFSAGEAILSLSFGPTYLSVNGSTIGSSVSPSAIDYAAPKRMIPGINRIRKKAGADRITVNDITAFDFAAADPPDMAWHAVLNVTQVTGGPITFWGSTHGTRVSEQ